jgi:ATP-dependent protease ClpP protease subunit
MYSYKRKLNNVNYITSKNKSAKKVENNVEDDINSIITNKDLLSKKNDDRKIERDCNHIYFYCEIDRESIYDLSVLIKESEEENILTSLKLNISDIPIYLHINSLGGSVFAAFNAIDIIKACKVPIYSIIEGSTASAGTLISVICEKKFIRPNAFMLIHELSSECWGKMSAIEDEFKNLQELMLKIKEIYKDNSSIPKKELNDLLKHDLWLNSEKCLKYGLVDELWNK